MAFDMHIKFEGGKVKIEGTSKHSKHDKEVPILAWSWGVSNMADLHSVGATGGGGKAQVQDLTFTKYVDASSAALLQACCTGARCDKATLYVTNATGEQTDYLKLELSDGVVVTSVSTGGSGGEDRLTENVTVHFAKFTYGFQPQTDEGKKEGGEKSFTFDIQKVTNS